MKLHKNFGKMKYELKQNGKPQTYASGAKGDDDTGKTRWDLIPIEAEERIAIVFTKGAEKYGDENWRKGIDPNKLYEKALRHLKTWKKGDNKEDHLAQCCVRLMMLMCSK